MATAARFFFLSALVWLACLAFAGPAELRDKVEKADNQSKFEALVPQLDKALGDNWAYSQVGDDNSQQNLDSWQDRQDVALKLLDNQVQAERSAKGDVSEPAVAAKAILAKPEYHDNGVSHDKNWLSQTLERAGKVIGDWLRNLFQKIFGNGSSMNAPSGFGKMNFQPVVWAFLIVGLVTFAWYAATRFRWSFRRRVKAGGLLDEDEPDRTADEWITRSDELTADHQYREAVRCLYLACLVRFDEANIMRFRRGETNWEHLHRYDASPRKPADIDLAAPTKSFDVIWYGHRTEGQADVDRFRSFYEKVVTATSKAKAA